MGRPWIDFLRCSDACGHGVQIYGDVGELAESVATYLAAGFDAGEPAIVVAARDHLGHFAARLEAKGWDRARIEDRRLLTVADADSMVGTIVRDGRPSEIAFEAVVGTLLDEAAERFPGK